MSGTKRLDSGPLNTGDIETRFMLDFAATWRHWGGGFEEDILVEFGLRTDDFSLRVREAIASGAAAYLGPEVIRELLFQCRRRAEATSATGDTAVGQSGS